MTSITIPNSVTSIGGWAFYECLNLNDIYMNSATPPTIENSTFNNYGKLHVVPGAKAAYTAATYWKNFNIIEDNIIATSITLNATSASLKVGETKTLTATVSPTNATNKNVTWSSSNTSVATVSTSGVVTAKAAGSAVITATAADGSGKKAECVITVITDTPQGVQATDISNISNVVYIDETEANSG
ncbi:MAG: Ig-like domain-containing protein, partial [Prevotellaceae bacterium]|nr:Ig-like domain-containing protein [Candidatus Faecinaster equi]